MLKKMTGLVCAVLVLGLASGASAGIIQDAQAAWYFGDDSGDDVSGNGATYNLADGANVGSGKVNIPGGGKARMELGSVASVLLDPGSGWTIYLQNADVSEAGGEFSDYVDIGQDGQQQSIALYQRGGLATDIWYQAEAGVGGDVRGSGIDLFIKFDGSWHVYGGASDGSGGLSYGPFGGTAALGSIPMGNRDDDVPHHSSSIAAEGVAVWDFKLSPEQQAEAVGAIPEPATIAVLGVGGLALLRRRK